MTEEMIERLASAAARIERERQRQSEVAKERLDTKKAKKLEEVARLFELADSSAAGLVALSRLLFSGVINVPVGVCAHAIHV